MSAQISLDAFAQRRIATRQFKMPESFVFAKDWYKNNPILTASLMSYSVILPDGEKFMVDTLREARDLIEDPILRSKITGFIGQEAQHGRAHHLLNAAGLQHNIDLPGMEKDFKQQFTDYIRHYTLVEKLAFIAAIEHFTSMYSEFTLKQESVRHNIPESLHCFMLWHAIEELEHKSVAFDVYQAISKNDVKTRRKQFFIAARLLSGFVFKYYGLIMQQGKYTVTWRNRRDAMVYGLGLKGFLPTNTKRALDYLKADFHPEQHKQSHLIDNWEARYPAVLAHTILL